MKNEKNIIEAEVKEEKALTVANSQPLDKPQHDTEFAHASAKMLMDIVKQNSWAKRLGGSQDHLQYEAWQTVGKYYGLSVKTGEAESVEIGGVAGFKAKAIVVNEITGVEVGGAEAYCMKDEYNWKSKPLFQLASMAQTRAGSKALRQLLGFVVALAGYNPTPAEEMDAPVKSAYQTARENPQAYKEPETKLLPPAMISEDQKIMIMQLLPKTGRTMLTLDEVVEYITDKTRKGKSISSYTEMTLKEAQSLIDWMEKKSLGQHEKKKEEIISTK